MPKVRFGKQVIECEVGENLRKVLMRARLPLYHPLSRIIHCRGFGTCGTCAVKLRGSVSWPTRTEAVRLRIPPHREESGLRLACQCSIQGDLVVEKFGGVWGQRLEKEVSFLSTQEAAKPDAQPVPSLEQSGELWDESQVELSEPALSETDTCSSDSSVPQEESSAERLQYQSWRRHKRKSRKRMLSVQASVSHRRRQRFTAPRPARNPIRPR